MAKTEAVRLKPSVWGIGLVALDLVLDIDDVEPLMSAGGTCGNVMVVLSHLGWNARPISRLGDDPAGEMVVADMQKWGVDVDQLRLAPTACTPMIVERIRRDAAGIPFHTFAFDCPGCGARLPRFQAVRSSSITHLLDCAKIPEVLFVDRVSRSALMIAEALSTKGTVIFFEPSGAGNPAHFAEMLELAHIVKYSHDRLEDLGELAWSPHMTLEIQTLGRGGLRFRTNLGRSESRRWHSFGALPVVGLKDTSGCGDWLTAGLIDSLCRGGLRKLRRVEMPRLLKAMSFGQGLAAWNCGFVGARGGMYALSRADLWRTIRGIAAGKQLSAHVESGSRLEPPLIAGGVCASCKPTMSRSRVRVG